MKFSVLLFFFTISLNTVNAQKRFSPKQMNDDLDSLIYFLEIAHPNPYYRYSKAKFHYSVDSAKSSLKKNLSYIEFYLIAQKLLAKLQDGHTDSQFPTYSPRNEKYFSFPYEVVLSFKKPFIIFKYDTYLKGQLVEKDTEILSINDINSEYIVKDIVDLVTGETINFRAKYGSKHFEFYINNIYPKRSANNLTFKEKGKIKKIELEKKDLRENLTNSINHSQKESKKTFDLTVPNKGTALMTLRNFEDLDAFKVFADSAFSEIKHLNTKNLIIDLRENLGGDSDVGDYLLQYILNVPFRQYDRILEKNSQLLKERLLSHRKGKKLTYADSTLLSKLNGSLDTIQNGNDEVMKLKNKYNGKIYLLISPITFSSAADFAQAFSFYKRGIIVGEESGGLILSFGDIVPAILPETRLPIVISSKLYLNIGASENDWHGVLPDVPCKADTAYERAIQMLN